MQASTVRTCAAAAAVPATLVVVGHLAYLWQLHPASADRQTAAFDHGLALAAILAAVLAAGRVAQWLEGRSGYVWGEVIGVVATIAVLAHLADDWRPGGAAISDVHILWRHLAALLAIALAVAIVRRAERRDAARPARRA